MTIKMCRCSVEIQTNAEKGLVSAAVSDALPLEMVMLYCFNFGTLWVLVERSFIKAGIFKTNRL
jgi:hypothetical protein